MHEANIYITQSVATVLTCSPHRGSEVSGQSDTGLKTGVILLQPLGAEFQVHLACRSYKEEDNG
jgi:hypothetical protein